MNTFDAQLSLLAAKSKILHELSNILPVFETFNKTVLGIAKDHKTSSTELWDWSLEQIFTVTEDDSNGSTIKANVITETATSEVKAEVETKEVKAEVKTEVEETKEVKAEVKKKPSEGKQVILRKKYPIRDQSPNKVDNKVVGNDNTIVAKHVSEAEIGCIAQECTQEIIPTNDDKRSTETKNTDIDFNNIRTSTDIELIKKALHDTNYRTREKAANNKNLDDKILIQVFKDDPSVKVRRIAIRNIKDQDFLQTTASNTAEDLDIRKSALKGIKDINFLERSLNENRDQGSLELLDYLDNLIKNLEKKS